MSFFTPPPTLPSPTEPLFFRERAIGFYEWTAGTMIAEMEALNDSVATAAAALTLNDVSDTSVSSVVIGSGSKSFTVSASKSYAAGMWLSIADAAAPNTNSMVGQVTSYSGTALVVNVPANAVRGSGTIATWVISLTAAPSTEIAATFAPVASAASLAASRTAMEVYSTTQTDAAIAAIAQIQPLTAVCVGNDLVITLGATKLDFRSTTLSSGAVTTVTTTTPTVFTVVNGATNGTTNGVSSRIEIIAMNNGGTLELATSVKSGGATVDDSTLVSTTAMSTGADSANTVYSTAARTNLAQRYVGFVEISQATAGVWASQPTKVQGAGGTVTQSVPPARSWKSPTRVAATTYTNDTLHERDVIIYGTQVNGFSASLTITVDGSTLLISSGADGNGGQFRPSATFTVPAGSTYSATVSLTAISTWKELD